MGDLLLGNVCQGCLVKGEVVFVPAISLAHLASVE